MGYTLVTKDALEAVMRRSGRNGFLIQESFRNDKYTILRLKEEPSLDNALRVAKHLEKHALGVVATAGGFAVRVKTEDKDLAYCLYNETLSNICGIQLIGMAKADAKFYQIHGVPTRMSDIELAKVLTMPRIGQASWTCHPETRLGPPRQGCKTILVKAADAPPKGVVKVRFNDDMILLQITEHQQKHRDLTIMQKADKIVQKIEEKEQGSYAQALGARPKAKPTPTKHSVFNIKEPAMRKPWSETDVEEDRERAKELMELDHTQLNQDETAGDFSDEELDALAADSPVARNRFGLPVSQPKQSPLQLRFDLLAKEREEAKERAEQENAELRAAQQRNENDIAQLLTQFEGLQATILQHQEENNAKFHQMQTKSEAQFAQMLAFFQKFEMSQKQAQVHGKGSTKGAPAAKRDGVVDDEEEDAHPKKLKVPFAALGMDPDAAASGC